MKTRIHINQHVIRRNKAEGRHDPCITVKRGKTNTYCHAVKILGPSEVVYADGVCTKPLSCGARCWVETTSEVIPIINEEKAK